MLQAQNGRQFNLAAKAVSAFFAEKDVVVKHSEALNLVARLTGHASYEAAKASLAGPAKGVAPDVQTWRQLAHAVGTLTEEQLDMPVQITEGCDCDGNATFTEARQLLMANADCIAAGTSIFPDHQPVLLVEEFNPVLESDEARRIEFQFEVATGEPAGMATEEIRRHGLAGAVETLNTDYSINISLGRFVAYSAAENGFWNSDFGYVHDKDSATGFESEQDIAHLGATETLTPILYCDAVDIDPDA
jgi:hypothetical protein